MKRADALAAFLASAASGGEPPTDGGAPLVGVWHALRGEWRLAHEAVQADERDRRCAWVHAALHREEGDLTNAGYWYRVAGRPVASGPMRDEYLAIARALLDA